MAGMRNLLSLGAGTQPLNTGAGVGGINSISTAVSSPTWSSANRGSSSFNGVVKAPAFIEVDPDAPAIELEHPAMQSDLTTLKNIWLVAYGNQWVRSSELDSFHWLTAIRLHKIGKMEKMYLTDGDKPVFRIIED